MVAPFAVGADHDTVRTLVPHRQRRSGGSVGGLDGGGLLDGVRPGAVPGGAAGPHLHLVGGAVGERSDGGADTDTGMGVRSPVAPGGIGGTSQHRGIGIGGGASPILHVIAGDSRPVDGGRGPRHRQPLMPGPPPSDHQASPAACGVGVAWDDPDQAPSPTLLEALTCTW